MMMSVSKWAILLIAINCGIQYGLCSGVPDICWESSFQVFFNTLLGNPELSCIKLNNNNNNVMNFLGYIYILRFPSSIYK